MRLTAAFLALLVTAPAHAFIAQNGLVVAPGGTGGFAVAYRGPSGASDFWCAAGDYAIRGLHLAPGRIIYRATDTPRRSGAPMRFSLDPASAAASTGIAQLGADDAGLSAGMAQSFCEFRHKRR
ncbi:MAG: hypothetical protein KDE11_03910 [Rhodobacteraceae bacterium]|nr:hypothetical protein [Paracoccaceae bacterium]